MDGDPATQITGLLDRLGAGDPHAANELFPLLREELRSLAAARLRALPPGQTLQPTALVHEAYIRLVGGAAGDPGWNGRGHFFGAAARAMRDVLVDRARAKGAIKRGGDRKRLTIEEGVIADDGEPERILELDAILRDLEQEYPEQAEVVNLRYFGGLTMEEIALAKGVATRTIERQWAFARAWLQRRSSQRDGASESGA